MVQRVSLGIVLACVGCSSSSNGGPGADAATDAATDAFVSNVDFAATTCSGPGACGGDPRGKWNIVSGCTQSTMGWCGSVTKGTVSGTYSIDTSGYTFQQDQELMACGRREGSGDSNSASSTISGSRLVFASGGGVDFCVQGDTLWILSPTATFPELAVVKLVRAPAGDAATP